MYLISYDYLLNTTFQKNQNLRRNAVTQFYNTFYEKFNYIKIQLHGDKN